MESIITSRAYIDIPHKPILLSGCIPGQKNIERSGTGIQIGSHNYKEVHISSYDYIIIFDYLLKCKVCSNWGNS